MERHYDLYQAAQLLGVKPMEVVDLVQKGLLSVQRQANGPARPRHPPKRNKPGSYLSFVPWPRRACASPSTPATPQRWRPLSMPAP